LEEQVMLERLREMMKESGAHLEGHFLLTSGNHSSDYMQCALLLRFPRYAAFAGEALAKKVRKYSPEIIASPALGGLIIGHETARALDIPFIFCERQDGAMALRRFPFPEGQRVVVIEDVVTTGVSSGEVGAVLAAGGAEWVGTGAVIDRSGGKSSLPSAPESLWKVDFPLWKPEECPLCAKGIPLVKPGSRPKKG
jgi:orotate phosphoribosyltransferase